jgi:hypothetical protein
MARVTSLGIVPRDPGLPWRPAQGVGRGGGAHASPPAPSQAVDLKPVNY